MLGRLPGNLIFAWLCDSWGARGVNSMSSQEVEVQFPARTEIWFQISTPSASLTMSAVVRWSKEAYTSFITILYVHGWSYNVFGKIRK